ncbi:tape measure protein [Pseudomonas mosselii]|uniref:tape measure protein n=3 Tax=Pseudomonas mosselii TaxID=78327 RepID=UPI0025A67182|nr:tape measure protein [Pseudomonas mosselii]WJR27772.1 tape measure protein [Pseudomonas mosselii]
MAQIERDTSASAQAVISSFKSVAAAAAAYLSVQQITHYTEAWIGFQNRIKQVSDSFESFSKQSQSVFAIAQSSNSALDATAELYQRISTSSNQLGASQEQVARVVLTISKALSAAGVSAAAAEGALLQLGQSFNSGTLRGEELNAVLEQAPPLAQAIADGLGVARESLKSMGEAGKLASKGVFGAILSQSQAIDDAFARSQTTISGAFQTMQNSATKLFGTLDGSLGVTKAVVDGMLALSRSWDTSGVEVYTQMLKTGLYVAIAKVALGLGNLYTSWQAGRAAAKEQAESAMMAANGSLRRAEASHAEALANQNAARQAVQAATSQVAAERQIAAAEITRLQAVMGSLAAEKQLEAQRLQAQITDVGRQQSVARMAELRLAEVSITNQLSAAEAKLAATTVASSAAVTGALTKQAAASEAVAVTTLQVSAAQYAANTATAAWAATATFAGRAIAGLQAAWGGLMRVMGGLPGLVLTVAAVGASFLTFGSNAEAGAGKAADAFEDASARIRRASREMIPENLTGQTYEQLQEKVAGLTKELKEAEQWQEVFQKSVDSGKNLSQGNLDRQKEKVGALRLALQELNKELNSPRLSSDKDGGTYLKNLEKQALLAGKLTETDKLRAQIKAGLLKLSAEDEKKAYAYAATADKAAKALKDSRASDKDSKALGKRFEDAEEGYRRQIELINTTTDKRKNATEADKLAFEISEGKYEKLTAQQKKSLEGYAAELDAKKALLKADQDAKKLDALKFNLNEDNRTAKDGLDQELAGAGQGDKYRERFRTMLAIEQDFNKQRREMYKEYKEAMLADDPDAEANYQKETEALDNALALRLEHQRDFYAKQDEMQSDWLSGVKDAWQNFADEAQNYSAMAADATTSVLGSARSELSSLMSDVATGSKDAGDALMDMVTGFAKSMVQALADMAAQWIVYQAVQLMVGKSTQSMAGMGMVANAQAMSFQAQLAAYASTAAIPIEGPLLAPAAAMTAAMATAPMVAGVASTALMGMAHDGIDSIPREGTWLLDGGERVLNPNQNRDLTQYLRNANDAGGGLGGGGITINAPVTVQAQAGMSDAEARRQGEMMGQAFEERVRDVMYRETQQNGILWRR